MVQHSVNREFDFQHLMFQVSCPFK